MRRWSRLSVQAAATGMPEGTSGPLAGLLVRLRPRTPDTTVVEGASPLPATLVLVWPAVVWAPSSTAWTAMTAEELTAPRWPDPTTAWLGLGRRASLCPRLPLVSHPDKAIGVEVWDFSTVLRRART